MKIQTFIINLRTRVERRKNVMKEFYGRDEFSVTLTEAFHHKTGGLGLWRSISQIIRNAINDEQEYILICEDDHQFTDNYSKELLFKNIHLAKNMEADILSGGISWFTNAFKVADNLYWIQKFSGLQFTIIFKKFFDKILAAPFDTNDDADYKISDISKMKLVIHPFISVQKDYGYSDVTEKNNIPNHVAALFKKSDEDFQILNRINALYSFSHDKKKSNNAGSKYYGNLYIPTHIICSTETPEHNLNWKKQFENKNEFEIQTISTYTTDLSLCLKFKKIVNIAINNNDDVIIICTGEHEFTSYYSKEYLIKNIIEANEQGVEYLSGGSSQNRLAVQASKNRYWVISCGRTCFFILYKRIFKKIIDEPLEKNSNIDVFLSEISGNKMIIFPFISSKKMFLQTSSHVNQTSLQEFDLLKNKIKKITDK